MNKYPSGIVVFAETILVLESLQIARPSQALEVSLSVCNKIRGPIVELAGTMGYHSLLSRSLSMAKQDRAQLGRLKIEGDGSIILEDFPSDADDLNGDGSILVIHFLGLLVTFVGEVMTMNILQRIWPSLSINRSTS